MDSPEEKTRLVQTIRLLIERAEAQGYLARQDILEFFPSALAEEDWISRITRRAFIRRDRNPGGR